MKLQTVLFLIMLFVVRQVDAQADTVFNQTDASGQKQGYWKKNYANGNLMYKGFFKNNLPDGEMRRYYESGGIQAILTYSDNGQRVFAKLYYEDGELSAEGIYRGTQKDSIWRYYSYYTNTLVSEEFYVSGKKQGLQKSFFPNGKLSEEIEYQNDVKSGKWVQYFDNGIKKMETKNQFNMVNGRYNLYYPSGTPYIIGTFIDNRRDGPWIFYEEDGKEKYRLHYTDGLINAKDEQILIEKDQQFFKSVDENMGKFEEPSIEDFYKPF